MDRMVVPLDDTQRRVAKDSELSKVQYRHCRVTDLSQCIELEAASYPVDEAASPEALRYRQKHANKYFLCAVLPGTNGTDQSNLSDDNECNPLDCSIATAKQQDRVIGFVCSTRCDAFTHESMSVHHPHGRLLAIHSVVVDAAFRNLGVATDMLRAYVQHVAKTDVNTNNNNANSTVQLDQKENPTASRPRLHTIVLLSKKHLLPLYINCGFRVMRPSAISHGVEQWYDLELDILPSSSILHYYVVDAFVDPTSSRGTGNPAAVVLLDSEPVGIDKAQWMQSVAHEFNLSETAFVWSMAQRKDEDGAVYSSVQYGIRYFTPTKEVPLCGHATLASAAVLFQTTLSDLPNAQVMIHTAEDVTLHACKKPSIVGSDNGRQCEITMTFPSKGFRELVSDDDILPVQSMLRVALNIDESDILYMGLADGLGDLLVEVTPSCFNAIGDTDDLNINALMYWDGYTRGVVVCCLMLKLVSIDGPLNDSRTISPVDFCSRFFGPKAGIPEDPVTGSAHCALAPYFASRLGKVSLVGRQMSSRGGFIQCELIHDFTCVDLTGTAAIVMSGELWM